VSTFFCLTNKSCRYCYGLGETSWHRSLGLQLQQLSLLVDQQLPCLLKAKRRSSNLQFETSESINKLASLHTAHDWICAGKGAFVTASPESCFMLQNGRDWLTIRNSYLSQ
jgi:hypothetical protein